MQVQNNSNSEYPRRLHYISAVLWPSFLAACVATMVFFAMFDPQELLQIMTWKFSLSREWAYSLGFFLFWLLTILSSSITLVLLLPGETEHLSKET